MGILPNPDWFLAMLARRFSLWTAGQLNFAIRALRIKSTRQCCCVIGCYHPPALAFARMAVLRWVGEFKDLTVERRTAGANPAIM